MTIESSGFLTGSQIDADKVDGIHASATPAANKLLALDASSNLPISVIADGAIVASKLAADAVETAKIKDANVTNAKLADNSIYGNKIKNVLRGIVPVASGWDTDPTTLANATDGDMSTSTGTGSKVMGASGNYGTLIFDLGSIKTVSISGRAGIWSSAGATSILISASDDGITYTASGSSVQSITSTSEQKVDFSRTVTGQYIKLTWYVNAASTANAKLYELMAHELAL